MVLAKDLSVGNETTTSIIFIFFKYNANYLVRYAKNIRSHKYQKSTKIKKKKKFLTVKIIQQFYIDELLLQSASTILWE